MNDLRDALVGLACILAAAALGAAVVALMGCEVSNPTDVLSYGGGRQTAAMCLLIEQGRLPRPDRIVIADTGREKPSTWEYLEEIIQPRMQRIGLPVEIAPRALAYVDLYAHNGDLLLPVYTPTGKLPAFCSNEWKQRVVERYLKQSGVADYTAWIGFALDERARIKSRAGKAFPLVDLALTKADCRRIISDAGLPMPPPSSCWMCPNMGNSEWRYVRDTYPDAWEQACKLDEEIREDDQAQGHAGVMEPHSRVALRLAPIDDDDGRDAKLEGRQCGLGMCFV